jgi:hypothetical protein
MGVPGKPRKKTPRARAGRSNPAASAALKAKWASDPVWAAKQRARPRTGVGRPAGVPDGMRRPEADKLWALAREKAAFIMDELEKENIVEFDPNIPEDQMAKLALQEALVMALSPLSDAKLKTTNVRTVLEWTKAKPATKTNLTLDSHVQWLEAVKADHRATKDDDEPSE